jgi:hypothetical protein
MSHKHSGSPARMEQRRAVRRTVDCPTCLAPAGFFCISKRRDGVRYACHQSRWDAYRATLG